jgi:hypothetical protein
VTAQDIPYPRPRLGSPNFPDGDHWFIFGPRNYEPNAAVVHPRERYDAIATHLIQLIDEQARGTVAAPEDTHLRSSGGTCSSGTGTQGCKVAGTAD